MEWEWKYTIIFSEHNGVNKKQSTVLELILLELIFLFFEIKNKEI